MCVILVLIITARTRVEAHAAVSTAKAVAAKKQKAQGNLQEPQCSHLHGDLPQIPPGHPDTGAREAAGELHICSSHKAGYFIGHALQHALQMPQTPFNVTFGQTNGATHGVCNIASLAPLCASRHSNRSAVILLEREPFDMIISGLLYHATTNSEPWTKCTLKKCTLPQDRCCVAKCDILARVMNNETVRGTEWWEDKGCSPQSLSAVVLSGGWDAGPGIEFATFLNRGLAANSWTPQVQWKNVRKVKSSVALQMLLWMMSLYPDAAEFHKELLTKFPGCSIRKCLSSFMAVPAAFHSNVSDILAATEVADGERPKIQEELSKADTSEHPSKHATDGVVPHEGREALKAIARQLDEMYLGGWIARSYQDPELYGAQC